MERRRRRFPAHILFALLPVLLLAAACTRTPDPTRPTGTSGNPAGLPDPLSTYSPAPTPFKAITEGFTGDTLTLSPAGGVSIHVTLVRTAMDLHEVAGLHAFDVWMTVENAGAAAWTGAPAAVMTITDASGAVYRPVSPAGADFYPKPRRYGVSNVDLHRSRTIPPGASISGVAVFRIPGGFRTIALAISLDGGTTWGTWQTSFGPS